LSIINPNPQDNPQNCDYSQNWMYYLYFFSLDFSASTFTTIGDYAFSDYLCLTGVTIPNSVTSIEDMAFDDIGGMTAINVGAANTAYTSQDGILYNKNITVLHRYPESKKGSSFTIPNSVTSIGNHAFEDCKYLTSITIPNSVTSIGVDAFDCDNLTSVTIPNSVTSIGYNAFEGDLEEKYKSGGAGTYTRSPGSDTWTKSS